MKMLNKNNHYYFIGIKGSGMSALALILNDLGYHVSGSDITEYTFTQKGLEDRQIEMLPFSEDNIKPGLSIIAGNAFSDDHMEIKKAHELGLKVVRYHDFVGQLIKSFTSIAIAGAHGKTSTTGLMAHVLGGIEPTSYLIGDGTGKAVKDSRFFAFEADEYQRHFIAYSPDYCVMTNIEFDHPDYFKDLDDVYDAFQQEASQVKKALFVYGDSKLLKSLKVDIPKYTYGFNKDDDFCATNIEKTAEGSSFDVNHHGKKLGRFMIKLYGDHSILNSLAVIGVSYMEGLDMAIVAEELLTFKGVQRRLAESKVKDMTIIDDYAHHPTEIDATISAVRQKYPEKEVIAVFQPHTYTRTKQFLSEFAKSLQEADHVFVTPIFGSAREQKGTVKSEDLIKKIEGSAHLITEETVDQLNQFSNAVLVFMGAGDVQKYERAYQKQYK